MAPPTHLNFITGNKNKLSEVQAILGDVIELRSQALDLVEIQARTMEEISKDKCKRAAEIVCLPAPSCMSLNERRDSRVIDIKEEEISRGHIRSDKRLVDSRNENREI